MRGRLRSRVSLPEQLVQRARGPRRAPASAPAPAPVGRRQTVQVGGGQPTLLQHGPHRPLEIRGERDPDGSRRRWPQQTGFNSEMDWFGIVLIGKRGNSVSVLALDDEWIDV